MASLKIAAWNTDGLSPNLEEIEVFLNSHNIDILLMSETHLTDNNIVKIRNYTVYSTNHPDGTAHAGAAVIIKSCIKHHELPQFKTPQIQAATVTIEDRNGSFNASAVYCPPKHNLKEGHYCDLFSTLGQRFIIGGDWNAKHVHWASRLTTTRGRELKKSLDKLKLTTISTEEPTHWPTDPNRLPDVIDFFITKGLSRLSYQIQTCLDSNTNHVPVILNIGITALNKEGITKLYNKRTDWASFRELVNKRLDLNIALKTETDIDDAVRVVTSVIQESCWTCTPELNDRPPQSKTYSDDICQKILEKRRLRRVWHCSRHPDDKKELNKAIRVLKNLITEANNAALDIRIAELSATSATNYSLWKACKNSNRPLHQKPPLRTDNGQWIRTAQDKAEAFAGHLSHVFTPNAPVQNTDETEIDLILSQDFQLDFPLKLVTPREIYRNLKSLKNNKAPGYDLIDKKVLEELPRKVFVFLTMLFNAMLRIGYFPTLWKVSTVIMVHKPGKPIHEVTAYRPISLLPIISKLFEKLLLHRMMSVIKQKSIIPDHQFGFRQEHATVEQVHRVCRVIRHSLEKKEYCSSAFLDIKQAFDKVWHKGLLFKIKSILPHTFYRILESYLSDRLFQVREGDCTSNFYEIHAGVPQGSVLGPVLYTLYTYDLPQTPGVTVATYADDTALLCSDASAAQASRVLQTGLNKIEEWLGKWRIAANVSKSVHVTFTLRRENCSPVTLNGAQLSHRDTVKYLGMYLDRRLTWQKHIKTKREEINLKYKGLYWLTGRNSKLAIDNKLLIYNFIIKPIWTYGIQLWGSASASNIMIIQRVQNYILKHISNAPWFIKTSEIHENLHMPTVKEEIAKHGESYKSRLEKHPNPLAGQLTIPETIRRLKKRRDIFDLDIDNAKEK